MPIVLHKFRDHIVNPRTEILVLGTFNPDVPDGPDFFYGRPRNFLCELLPGCWGLPSLKDQLLEAKQAFMAQYKIDFADKIHSIEVPEREEENVDDTYIDDKVNFWKTIDFILKDLKQIKAVYFTRKTFQRIPNIHDYILTIQNYCQQKGIRFCLLRTPARFTNTAKQQQWIDTIINRVTFLQS
jgi:G:T/U-mismatch repair DNA glycosylase